MRPGRHKVQQQRQGDISGRHDEREWGGGGRLLRAAADWYRRIGKGGAGQDVLERRR